MISIRNTANCDFGQKLLKDIKIKKDFLVDNLAFKDKKQHTTHQRQNNRDLD